MMHYSDLTSTDSIQLMQQIEQLKLLLNISSDQIVNKAKAKAPDNVSYQSFNGKAEYDEHER